MSQRNRKDPGVPVRLWRLYQDQKYRVRGAIIFMVGIAALVWTGVTAASKTSPPSTSQLVVLLGVSAALPVWAGVTFGKIGHVDADKAKSAVRHLFAIAMSVRGLREELQEAIQSEGASEIEAAALRSERGLQDLTMYLRGAMADWTDIHPEALALVLASEEEQAHQVRERRIEDHD